MKKVILIMALMVGIVATNCATLHVEGNGQVLAQPNEAWKVYKTYKNIYLLYGLFPISDVSTQGKLPKSGKVRIEKQYTIVDWLISALTWGIIYTETIKIYTD